MKQAAGKEEYFKYVYRGLADLIITFIPTALFWLLWMKRLNPMLDKPYLHKGNLAMAGIYLILTAVMIQMLGGYEIGVSRISHLIMSQTIGLFFTNILMLIITIMMNGWMGRIPRLSLLFLLLFAVEIVGLFFVTWFLIKLYRRIFPPFQMLQIYGSEDRTLALKISLRGDKYTIADEISCSAPEGEIEKKIDDADAVLLSAVPEPIRAHVLQYCFRSRKRVYFSPEISDILIRGAEELDLFDSPLCLRRNTGMNPIQRVIKRAGDIVISLIGIAITSPLMLAVAAAVHFYDKGPVFYRQRRYTIGGKEFEILKFRSMIIHAEKETGAVLAGERDSRITPVGRVIRATRMDELPQFFNVLKGDMSIVGPRPERPTIHKQYCEKTPEFDYRLRVKAGLTGYAQVYGKYNTTAEDKLKFDLIYVENASIHLDLQLILLTLRVIFQKEATEGLEDGKTIAK